MSSNNYKEWVPQAFASHYKEMVIYAQRYLYDLGESEDIVQEIFVQLWENPDRIDIHTSTKSYLFAMVRNKCLNFLKTIKITDDLGVLQKVAQAEALEESDYKEENFSTKFEEVKKLIQVMPTSMKEIFELKYLSNFSYAEIAIELNISPNTVKTQLKRAKARILQVISYVIIFYIY